MAYFNHAFTKIFLGTQTTGSGSGQNPNPNLSNGFVTLAGVPTVNLTLTSTTTPANNYGTGSYGFFNPNTYLSETVSTIAGSECCPLLLASASLLKDDKIGPFHGGYKETNKSKLINPRYVQRWYRVDPCVPQQSVVSIGTAGVSAGNGAVVGAPTIGTNTYAVIAPGPTTTYTNIFLTGGTGSNAAATVVVDNATGLITSVTITSPGNGYTVGNVLTVAFTVSPIVTPGYLTKTGGATATTVTVTSVVQPSGTYQGGTNASDCKKDFLCGETYYLRIDVKGSPALRFLNHNAYQTVSAYTGCCSTTVPTAVDSTTVMIQWAEAIVINNYLKDLILPVVFDESGNAWYAPGTTVDPITGAAVSSTQWWTNYPTGTTHIVGATAGLRLFGAYVETKFGNCSFQITDFFEKEPVRIYASLVDYNGDPCVFENLCVYNDCLGLQGMGFGEQVVRDLILAESYLQNFFHTDIRVREITQGDQILGSVNRNALYTRYFLLHSVPRFNNPTGTFDNDRYLLEIISNTANAALEAFVACVSLETENCTPCVVNVNGVA